VLLRKIPLFILALFAIEALIVLCHILFAALFPFHNSVALFFNLNEEGNLPAWFSAIQLYSVAILLFMFFWGKREQGDFSWGVLLGAAGFLFLSVDEGAKVHERVGTIIDAIVVGGATSIQDVTHDNHGDLLLPVTGYWMFYLGPVALVALFLWWRSIRRFTETSRNSQTKVLIGALIFLASATLPEIFSNFLIGNLFAMHAELVIEEWGEMLGITICLWGVFELCRDHNINLDFTRQ